jgi:hypothetical protein
MAKKRKTKKSGGSDWGGPRLHYLERGDGLLGFSLERKAKKKTAKKMKKKK